MANYNKPFNFRNGVQVDNDNFIVNANGLVGIGTTIPKDYLLNVYGDARITGLVTVSNINTTNLNVGLATISNLNVGITSISSGIITASSGVIIYYGDGSKLSNLPTSQWIDVNLGTGVTSIYAVGNVGIATTSPVFTFQVGPNPLVVSDGIGINSTGDVYTAGIITAVSFSGNGSNLSSLNASNITSGTLSTSFFPSSIALSGIVTASSFVGSGENLTAINAGNITSGTLNTNRLPSNVIVSGIITASSFVGNLTGTATTATTLAPTGTISVTSVNSGFTSTGIATVSQALYVTGFPAKIGVGTNLEPEADIEVNKTGISSIRVISGNNVATIGIGRSAEVRTGNTNTFYAYSTRESLDIINSNSSNVNYYLDYGTAGLGTGAFHWIYGQNPTNPLMSLTYNGNLGIGITNPSSRLYVIGSSYITGITTIDSNLNVNNNLYVSNDLEVSGNVTFTGSLNGNLGITTISRLGIATNTILGNSYEFFVGGDPTLGEGVSITKTSIRASGNIRSTSITSTDINNTGVITSTNFYGNLIGSLTGYATTAFNAINVSGGIVENVSSVGVGTTSINNENTSLYVVGNNEFYGNTITSGVTTSVGGFTSGIGTAVKITTVGNRIIFTVPGVGTTSLTLF